MHFATQLRRWWDSERSRHFLWLPVGFAVGIAMYFALPFEPSTWAVVASSVVMATAGIALWRTVRPLALMLLLTAAGFSWAYVGTHRQQQPVIAQAMEPQWVRGTVHAIERTADGFRVTLDAVSLQHVAAEETPARVRLTIKPKRGSMPELPPVGARVEIRAGLLPPMGPALPGAFDFARYFYFNGIGAVGFGLPPLTVVADDAAGSVAPSLHNRFWTWRTNLSDRILRQLGPETGPVAAGLITGDARAITDENFDALRASNLYHIIAISGEHMVVISGVIFLLLRVLTLCLPSRWRYLPAMKSHAAALTLALVTLYLFVTGLPVSAIRAYVMIALVLMAIIARRQVHPMRSLSIAAFAMLLYQPADLFDPGFQLSFSATIAIIALVEWWQKPSMRDASRLQKFLRGIIAMLLISVVAEAATAPFVLSQFNTLSPYGVLANMLATPLVSFVLMPLVALFFLLLPLGLSDSALWLMDYGVRALLWIAHTVSSWPHALQAFPSPPGWAVALFAFGLLWVCIWQKRPRYLAVPLMIVSVASIAFVRPPDMLIGAQLKQIAFRTDGDYVLARGRTSSLLPKLWANGVGYVEFARVPRDDSVWQCAQKNCTARVKGVHHVAFVEDAEALAEACAHAEIVVTRLSPASCTAPTVIDGEALRHGGIHAVWFTERGTRIATTRQWQKQRPWNGA